MKKYVVYDTRAYIVEAEDENEAFDVYTEMSQEQADECEVEGGGIEVDPHYRLS
jgi:hypothetical protein